VFVLLCSVAVSWWITGAGTSWVYVVYLGSEGGYVGGGVRVVVGNDMYTKEGEGGMVVSVFSVFVLFIINSNMGLHLSANVSFMCIFCLLTLYM
jgi:hypothetical protein